MIENDFGEWRIRCGREEDGVDRLEELVRKDAEQLISRISLPPNESLEVQAWTKSLFSDYICSVVFNADNSGNISYELDFSESCI